MFIWLCRYASVYYGADVHVPAACLVNYHFNFFVNEWKKQKFSLSGILGKQQNDWFL